MTMKLIETVSVGASGASTINFASISQSYTDLMILASVRVGTTTGSTWADTGLTFNGSGTGYSGRILYGQGSAAASIVEGGDTFIDVRVQSNDGTSNVFSNTSIYIPNYTAAIPKSVSYETVTENNATSSLQSISAGYWNNTAAITSLSFNTSIFVQNSTISLYGILKGSEGASAGVLGYDFNNSVQGWTASAANLSVSGGILTQAVTGNDPNITSPTISMNGSDARYLKITFKRVNAGQSPNWDGTVFYSTTGHSFSASYYKQFAEPIWDGNYKTVTLDMHSLTVGGTDWQSSTITQFRIDFSNAQSDGNFLVDSITVSPTP